MISKIELLKGIHPGVYLARELQRRELRGGTLASRIGAYRQNLNAILQGRRNMNLPLSLKIEQELDLPEGFLMTLQLHYDRLAQEPLFRHTACFRKRRRTGDRRSYPFLWTRGDSAQPALRRESLCGQSEGKRP